MRKQYCNYLILMHNHGPLYCNIQQYNVEAILDLKYCITPMVIHGGCGLPSHDVLAARADYGYQGLAGLYPFDGYKVQNGIH